MSWYILCSGCKLVLFFLFRLLCWLFCFFFFKQKTAYEMRISDWSSDVCSSDLNVRAAGAEDQGHQARAQPHLERILPVVRPPPRPRQIGRASCRERVCQYV